MDGASIVEIILQNLMELMPFRIVMSYQWGVRWTWGQNPEWKNPGFHWCVPLMHTFDMTSATEEVIDLPTQTVTTKDGKQVSFSCNVGIKIVDPVAHYCNVHDFDHSVIALAMNHLARRVRDGDYEALRVDLASLEKSLVNTLETKLKRWGAEVTTVGFTDFVLTRQFRFFQDKPK